MPARQAPESAPSNLQTELAGRILRLLKDRNAGPGHHLVELELCRAFGVSRTPVRGALRLLAAEGTLEPRANRGFVLTRKVTAAPDGEPGRQDDEEARHLLNALAQARNAGRLADRFTQQEIVRRFAVRLPVVLRVLHQLADLGLVERMPGNGWTFSGDVARAKTESYAFRRALEPAMLLQPTFKLDRAWLETARAAHVKFRSRPWKDSDAVAFHELNADFHEQLARCSGNRYMLDAVRQQNQVRHFIDHQAEYDARRVHAAIDDHLEILAALEGGWNDKASALMQHHLAVSAIHARDEAQ